MRKFFCINACFLLISLAVCAQKNNIKHPPCPSTGHIKNKLSHYFDEVDSCHISKLGFCIYYMGGFCKLGGNIADRLTTLQKRHLIPGNEDWMGYGSAMLCKFDRDTVEIAVPSYLVDRLRPLDKPRVLNVQAWMLTAYYKRYGWCNDLVVWQINDK